MDAQTKICSVPRCTNIVRARGYCASHHSNWLRRGAAEYTGLKSGACSEYIINVVLPYDGDECLLWPFSGNGIGYGQVYYNGKRQYAHRIACEEHNGAAPTPQHEAAHSCGNGKNGCVAKRHLIWKTHADNMADMAVHGTKPKGESHPASKLTADQVRQIREMRGTDTQKNIGKKFGISGSRVCEIQLGRGWVDETAQAAWANEMEFA